jgi:hypothetical protein
MAFMGKFRNLITGVGDILKKHTSNYKKSKQKGNETKPLNTSGSIELTKLWLIKTILFVVSSIFTILLFTSQGTSQLSIYAMGCVGLALELAKFLLAVVGVRGYIFNTTLGKPTRAILLLISGLLFYYSIMATEGFQLIELQEKEQTTFKDSYEFTSFQEKKTLIKDQIARKEKVQQDLIIEKNNVQQNNKQSSQDTAKKIDEVDKQLAFQRKELSKKEIELQAESKRTAGKGTGVQRVKNAIASINNNIEQLNSDKKILMGKSVTSIDYIAKIETINKEIDTLQNEYNNMKTENVTKEQKYGYSILFETQESLNLFFLGLAILIEIVAVLVSVLYDKRVKTIVKTSITLENTTMPEETSEKNITIFKPKKDLLPDLQVFSDSKTEQLKNLFDVVNKETVKMYIETSIVGDKAVTGYKKTSELIGITAHKGLIIHGLLSSLGLIKKVGNRYYATTTIEEILKTLKI